MKSRVIDGCTQEGGRCGLLCPHSIASSTTAYGIVFAFPALPVGHQHKLQIPLSLGFLLSPSTESRSIGFFVFLHQRYQLAYNLRHSLYWRFAFDPLVSWGHNPEVWSLSKPVPWGPCFRLRISPKLSRGPFPSISGIRDLLRTRVSSKAPPIDTHKVLTSDTSRAPADTNFSRHTITISLA